MIELKSSLFFSYNLVAALNFNFRELRFKVKISYLSNTGRNSAGKQVSSGMNLIYFTVDYI